MDYQSIRFRYTAAFSSIALFFIIVVVMNFTLISKTEHGMVTFAQNFNPAISAVINADRDLYQARVAELQILVSPPGTERASGFKSDYDENAQQAYDRMQKYKQLLSDFPDILAKINQFESSYKSWKSSSERVFDLAARNQLDEAKALSDGQSKDEFGKLRDFYDIAGEAADKAGLALSETTIEEVSASETLLIVFSVIVVLFTLILGFIAPKTMADALDNLSDKLKGINSGDGDLTRRINSDRKDEIKAVADDFDELLDGLSELIGSIVNQSSSVIDGVEHMAEGAQQVRNTSQQQTESVETIVTAVNEMAFAIKEVAQNAQSTAEEVDQVNQLTQEGSQVTTSAVEQIQHLSDTVQKAATVIEKLEENSSQIASVLDVIRGIAEQTNLLALNAAIEAARAGEQGRGFAVVADEVRNLASKTQQSTEDIQKMIETLQDGVNEAVDSINAGTGMTESTVSLSQQTLDALENIMAAANRVSDMTAQTATATEQQSQVAEDVNRNLTILSDHTRENYDVATNNGELANSTLESAQTLSDSVTRFKLS